MNRSVRAHFDGNQVVLDEPASFEPGEELVVASLRPGPHPTRETLLAQLAAAQGVRSYRSLAELAEDLGPPEAAETDLWEVIHQDRLERRRAAAEALQEDEWE
jgi:hypothetical protein